MNSNINIIIIGSYLLCFASIIGNLIFNLIYYFILHLNLLFIIHYLLLLFLILQINEYYIIEFFINNLILYCDFYLITGLHFHLGLDSKNIWYFGGFP